MAALVLESLVLGFAVLFAIYQLLLRRPRLKLPQPPPSTSAAQDPSPRQLDQPRFQTTITPLADFSLEDTQPIPYRPVRWNKYPITMGIRNLAFDDWYQLDHEWVLTSCSGIGRPSHNRDHVPG